MKLYHGTSRSRAKSILARGLQPTCNQHSTHERLVHEACIYGFDNFGDAESFAIDQCFNSGLAVVCFEASDCKLDPEYDNAEFQHGLAYYTTQPASEINEVSI